jgi:UDP-N-acetylmuramoyl-L-alanyl-D-glutamate--2,6-diaminopimelate ligase
LKRIYHRCIPILADWYYGRPGKKMIVIGVTGTKGKSTTCRLIASVLEAGGYKVGLMSTVEFQIGDRRWLNDKKMSMLGRGKIQKMMKEMVKAGCGYALIETSSEGILQNRHLGVHYDIAVFTNLGTEHSERHGGFEKLKSDKGKLFSGLAKEKNKILRGGKIDKVIVTNAEDPHASYFASFPADKK